MRKKKKAAPAADPIAAQTTRNIKRYCDVMDEVLVAVDANLDIPEEERFGVALAIFDRFFTDQDSALSRESQSEHITGLTTHMRRL